MLQTIRACREAHPQSYVKVNAFDSTQGWETVRLSFIVQRPADEAGFHLVREEGPGRIVRYSVRSRGEAVPRPQAHEEGDVTTGATSHGPTPPAGRAAAAGGDEVSSPPSTRSRTSRRSWRSSTASSSGSRR